MKLDPNPIKKKQVKSTSTKVESCGTCKGTGTLNELPCDNPSCINGKIFTKQKKMNNDNA